MEINVVPLGTETPSVGKYLVKALKILKNEKDIKYDLTSMGTVAEGDLERLLSLAKRMHEAVFDDKVLRVVTTIKIDDRRAKPLSMEGKMKSIQSYEVADDMTNKNEDDEVKI